MEVTIKADNRLKKALKKAPLTMQKYVSLGIREAGNVVRNSATRLAPYKTGNLRGSITVKDNKDLSVSVGTNVVYARIQEFGGEIRPVRAKVLRFKIGGADVFAKRVNIRPKPYLLPALSRNEKNIDYKVKQFVDLGLRVIFK